MKKHLLKILALVLMICAVLCVFTACGGDSENENSTPPHVHEYNTLKKGDTEHWNECECGVFLYKEEHSFIDGKCECGKKVPSQGLIIRLINNDTEYEIIGLGFCLDAEVVIPHMVGDKPVTSIGEKAFYRYPTLISVEIPASVTIIKECAFMSIHELESVNICANSQLKIIEEAAFCDLRNLTSFIFPNSVTEIGESSFAGCEKLTSIEIPNSVKTIGHEAFLECFGLQEVKIGNSVEYIGWGAFAECIELTDIFIPDSVTSIGDGAFEWCDSLTSISFKGTIAEWNAISKGRYWNDDVPATYVQCSDGRVNI